MKIRTAVALTLSIGLMAHQGALRASDLQKIAKEVTFESLPARGPNPEVQQDPQYHAALSEFGATAANEQAKLLNRFVLGKVVEAFDNAAAQANVGPNLPQGPVPVGPDGITPLNSNWGSEDNGKFW